MWTDRISMASLSICLHLLPKLYPDINLKGLKDAMGNNDTEGHTEFTLVMYGVCAMWCG